MNEYKKTIFLDIDGCILYHLGNLSKQYLDEPSIIPATLQKLNEWEAQGHRIILTTGRKESMRRKTEADLEKLGIFYDQLVMGLPRGERVIINDRKPDSDMSTARAIMITRNGGIGNIKLNENL